jgi:hypothetical protein
MKRATLKTKYVYSPGADQYVEVMGVPEDPPEVKTKQCRGEKQAEEAFAMVPLWFAALAAKAAHSPAALVWVYVLYCAWQAKGDSFPLGNRWLERNGVSRKTKARVLRDLGGTSLFEVEWQSNKAPRITVKGRLQRFLMQVGVPRRRDR